MYLFYKLMSNIKKELCERFGDIVEHFGRLLFLVKKIAGGKSARIRELYVRDFSL